MNEKRSKLVFTLLCISLVVNVYLLIDNRIKHNKIDFLLQDQFMVGYKNTINNIIKDLEDYKFDNVNQALSQLNEIEHMAKYIKYLKEDVKFYCGVSDSVNQFLVYISSKKALTNDDVIKIDTFTGILKEVQAYVKDKNTSEVFSSDSISFICKVRSQIISLTLYD